MRLRQSFIAEEPETSHRDSDLVLEVSDNVDQRYSGASQGVWNPYGSKIIQDFMLYQSEQEARDLGIISNDQNRDIRRYENILGIEDLYMGTNGVNQHPKADSDRHFKTGHLR